jgi:small-conductance mechanosensitive channel
MFIDKSMLHTSMYLPAVYSFLLSIGLSENVSNYLIILTISLLGIIIFSTIKIIIVRILYRHHGRTQAKKHEILLELIKVFSWPLYLIISLNFALSLLTNLPPKTQDIVEFAALAMTVFYVCLIARKALHIAIEFVINKGLTNSSVENEVFDPTVFKFLEFIAGLVIWAVAIIFILQNRNIRVDALVGGLGVAGIGFAFALQNILADLFASVSIYTDKPFVIGDHIQVGDDIGVVTKIGLKTTRMRTLKGDEMIFSNRDLSNSRIKNLARISKRKVFMEIILDKKYPKTKLQKVPNYLEKIVTSIPKTKFFAAYLKEVREDNFVFWLEYDVQRVNYKEFLSIQNTINLDIIENFKTGQVDFKIV